MVEDIAGQLKNMTAANGYVPAIVDVQVVSSLDEWKRKNLSVAVMQIKEGSAGVHLSVTPGSTSERALRLNITEMLGINYEVDPQDSELPLLISDPNFQESTDAIAAEERDSCGQGGIDGWDG